MGFTRFNVLSATRDDRSLSRASNTIPMPPEPISRTSANLGVPLKSAGSVPVFRAIASLTFLLRWILNLNPGADNELRSDSMLHPSAGSRYAEFGLGATR